MSETYWKNPGISAEGTAIKRGIISQVVAFDELDAEAAAQNIAISGFPPNAYTIDAWVHPLEDFEGGSSESCTVQIGDAGNPDGLMTPQSVFTDVAAASTIVAGRGADVGVYEAAYEPVARFTVTGSGINVDDLTAGKCIVCIEYKQIVKT